LIGTVVCTAAHSTRDPPDDLGIVAADTIARVRTDAVVASFISPGIDNRLRRRCATSYLVKILTIWGVRTVDELSLLAVLLTAYACGPAGLAVLK
jgi:hypothetical protein